MNLRKASRKVTNYIKNQATKMFRPKTYSKPASTFHTYDPPRTSMRAPSTTYPIIPMAAPSRHSFAGFSKRFDIEDIKTDTTYENAVNASLTCTTGVAREGPKSHLLDSEQESIIYYDDSQQLGPITIHVDGNRGYYALMSQIGHLRDGNRVLDMALVRRVHNKVADAGCGLAKSRAYENGLANEFFMKFWNSVSVEATGGDNENKDEPREYMDWVKNGIIITLEQFKEQLDEDVEIAKEEKRTGVKFVRPNTPRFGHGSRRFFSQAPGHGHDSDSATPPSSPSHSHGFGPSSSSGGYEWSHTGGFQWSQPRSRGGSQG